MQLKEVSSLKGKIKNLGSVNLDSIEEYKQTIARYEFLSTQKKICKIRRKLDSIIKELEDGMRKQFRESLKKLKENLILYLKNFGGGTADLELTSDDLLDAGVVIIAQPPGKTTNMMQLSGGEKALTEFHYYLLYKA